MKIFISQKFRNLTEEVILKRKDLLLKLVHENYDNVEIIENYHPEFDKNSVKQLGESIKEMSDADLVLISDTSLYNIAEFIRTASTNNFKGSEFEVMMSMSYDIPYVVYGFNEDDDGNISVEWKDFSTFKEELGL